MEVAAHPHPLRCPRTHAGSTLVGRRVIAAFSDTDTVYAVGADQRSRLARPGLCSLRITLVRRCAGEAERNNLVWKAMRYPTVLVPSPWMPMIVTSNTPPCLCRSSGSSGDSRKVCEFPVIVPCPVSTLICAVAARIGGQTSSWPAVHSKFGALPA